MNAKIEKSNKLNSKYLYLLLLLLGIAKFGNAQYNYAKNWELSSPYTSDIWIAIDYISLKQGFSTQASWKNSFLAKLDESLIFPIAYQTAVDAGTRTLNTSSCKYGSITGSFSVSPTGAATYTIPIFTSPGTNGMVPSINISYNSNGGNGLLGIGFNLNCVSAITRVGQNLYNDGAIKTVNFSATDRFALDGNRLICVNGTYGAAGAEYRTENETFSKIIQNADNSFTVTSKNGIVIRYGYTGTYNNSSNNSKMSLGNDNGPNLAYFISDITDISGNSVRYYYNKDYSKNEYWLDRIEYTGNDAVGIAPYNQIKFIYESKTEDISTSFVNGYAIKSGLLLKKIKVYAEANIVRTYEMNYIFDRYSFLNEIIEKDANGNQFNSTAFSWTNYKQDDSYSIITPIVTSCTGNGIFFWEYYGDYNGDGLTDIIRIYYNEHTFIPYAFNMNINIKDGSWFTCSQIGIFIDESFRGLTVCDYNGDGLDDIIIKKEVTNSNYFSLYYSNYTNGNENFIGGGNISNQTYTSSALETSADFDGDGKDELLTFQVTFPMPIGTPILFGARIVGNSQSNIILNLNSLPDKVIPFDFNGDGKKDVMLIFDTECKIYDGNLQTVLYDSGYPTKYHKIYAGDFNGDGKTDILTYVNGSWEMSYSNGIGLCGFNSQSIPPISTTDPDASDRYNNISIGDFNGDGTSDILEYTANGHVNLYYMNQQKYFTYSFDIPNFNNNFIAEQKWDRLVDFNGDGKMDIALKRSILLDFIAFNPKAIKNKLKCIVDGLNRKTEIGYDYITNVNYNNVYTKGTNATYPIVDVQIPLSVVYYTHEEDLSGSGNCIFSSVYHYTGAKINSLGKGFFGFQTFEKTNQFSKQKLNFNYVLENAKSNNFFYTYLEKEENYNCDITTFPPTYNLIGSTTYTTSIHNFGNQRILPYIHIIESENVLSKIHTKKVYEYDHANWEYGNIISIKNSFLDGTVEKSSTLETYSNYITAGGWCPNKYTSKTIIYSRTGAPNKTRTTNYAWYPNGLLQNEVNDLNVTTSFLYDACGNPTQVKVSGSDIADRISTMEYEQPKRRFVIKATNPEGHIVEQKYEPKYGNPIWGKDENGLITTNIYDAFGQLKETTLPTGVKVNYTTDWSNGQGPANTIGYGKVESNGASTIEYKDKLGRTTRTKTEGYNGKEIYSDNIYNNKGQLWQTSYLDPFNSVQWTEYIYDINGRITTAISPSATITTDYTVLPTGLQIVKTNTTANPIQTKTTKYDLTGAVSSVNDAAGGLLSYPNYNSYGQPLTINSVGYTTTMEYDDYGRQTKLIDTDSKTTSYEYFSTGELKKQTDGKNNISQMTYDKLGRIKTNNISNDGSYTYIYDTRTKGIGSLSSIIGPNGMETHYEYNQFGWNNKITEVIPGQSNFVTNCTYDIYGNNTQITYPSGYTINRMFDNKGNLTKVTQASDNKTIWELTSTDYMGNIDQYKTANNNVTVNNGFDHNTGNLNEIEYTRNDNNNAFFDYSYSFDAATGNLMSRTDKTRLNLTESFLYDNLERLTNWGDKETTYNPSGTINYKSDIMAPGNNYAYTQSFGHGVYQISGVNTNTISTNPQDITYNSFNKISTINEGSNSMSFVYGTDQSRKKVLNYNNGQIVSTTYYSTNYEKEVTASNTKEFNYIAGGNGLAAIYIANNGTGTLHYVMQDHLGSIMGLFNEDGVVEEEYSYDAWGKRRNPVNWSYTYTSPTLINRGYTGHEHLDQFGLINMNGRLYDPTIGQMLSPDNYIQNPNNTQNYNRYSYCLNNPLKYTDPTGEWINFVIGAVIGGFSGWQIGEAAGATGWKMAGYIAAGAVIGAATAGIGSTVSAGIGASVGSCSWAGAASYIVGGSVAGGFNSLAFAELSGNHTNEGLGFLTGAIGGAFQGAIGGGGGAFAGGAASSITGDYLRGERDYSDLFISGLIGGSLSYGSYELSTSISYLSARNEMPKNITYKEYKAILSISQQSTFWNREGAVVSENGKIHTYLGNENDVNQKIYPNTKFAYHFHEDVGYDGFSTPTQNPIKNDITSYTNAFDAGCRYNNMLGTREGNIWFMSNPNMTPIKFNYNFAPYYYPFHIYCF